MTPNLQDGEHTPRGYLVGDKKGEMHHPPDNRKPIVPHTASHLTL